MDYRAKTAFLALIVVQALHSVEEYAFRLYDVFPPARLLSSLISEDLRTGFVVINVGLIAFGLWCWLVPIRRGHSSAQRLAWLWVTIELLNGIGHPAWTVSERAYAPGVATAPLLLILAVYLARRLFKECSRPWSDGHRLESYEVIEDRVRRPARRIGGQGTPDTTD